MEITSIKVEKAINPKNESLLGYASITLDNELAIHTLRIIKNKKTNRVFVAFPNKIKRNNLTSDICHPINSNFRRKVEKAILDEFNKR